MKVESRFLLFLAAFGFVVAAIYWYTGYSFRDNGGTVMLIAVGLLGLLPGLYYFWWGRRMTPRPEDDPHSELADGAGVVATFPSSSIWPFVLGLGAACVGIALVFGFWSAIVGFFLAITATAGIIRESRHGGLA